MVHDVSSKGWGDSDKVFNSNSRFKVTSTGLFGGRIVNVTKGADGKPWSKESNFDQIIRVLGREIDKYAHDPKKREELREILEDAKLTDRVTRKDTYSNGIFQKIGEFLGNHSNRDKDWAKLNAQLDAYDVLEFKGHVDVTPNLIGGRDIELNPIHNVFKAKIEGKYAKTDFDSLMKAVQSKIDNASTKNEIEQAKKDLDKVVMLEEQEKGLFYSETRLNELNALKIAYNLRKNAIDIYHSYESKNPNEKKDKSTTGEELLKVKTPLFGRRYIHATVNKNKVKTNFDEMFKVLDLKVKNLEDSIKNKLHTSNNSFLDKTDDLYIEKNKLKNISNQLYKANKSKSFFKDKSIYKHRKTHLDGKVFPKLNELEQKFKENNI